MVSTEAGVAAFEGGGNALDAALAAAFSLAVSYPDNSGLGGDMIALVRLADGRSAVVNGSGPAAAAVDVETLRARGHIPLRGPDSVTVPGLVAGLAAIAELGASRSWPDHLEAAIDQAEFGIEVPPSLAASIVRDTADLAADPGCRELFLPNGVALGAGQKLCQPALAETLRTLATDGASAFYRGAIGASLVAFLRAQGSPLAAADLESFVPEITKPLEHRIADWEVAVAPPNSQGFSLPLYLAAERLHPGGLDPLGAGAGKLAQIFLAGLHLRERHLADPRTGDVLLDALAPQTIEAVSQGLDTSSVAEGLRGTGDTVAIVTSDEAGNSVSLLESLFHGFGAAVRDPETGIMLHNRGACFSLDPDSPNVLAPRKRPAHTLSPCIVSRAGRPWVAIATMGGSAQTQILTQVLLRLRAGDEAGVALAAPRWIAGAAGNHQSRSSLTMESGVPAPARAALEGLELQLAQLERYDSQLGHAQMIVTETDGFVAASDPRSEGSAAVG